jgi:hypothetical protein
MLFCTSGALAGIASAGASPPNRATQGAAEK